MSRVPKSGQVDSWQVNMKSFEESSLRRRLRSSEQAIKSFSIVLKSWYFRKTKVVLTVFILLC